MTKIKPNPAGKDRGAEGDIDGVLLAGEWIDVKNESYQSISLNSISLQHKVYPSNFIQEWQDLFNFSGITIGPNETIRIHSGGYNGNLSNLNLIDTDGADRHFFTGNYYAWNNTGDEARILTNQTNYYLSNFQEIDSAKYIGPVREGARLHRIGNIFMDLG